MGTFPPSLSQPGNDGGSPVAPPPTDAGSSAIKLAMLGSLIQGLAAQFPGADQGIKMMMDGLRMVQASAASQSAPPQPAAPPV